MRTTLSIDDDVLQAAQDIGRRTKRSAGKVLSELARESLVRSTEPTEADSTATHGFAPIPRRGAGVVTNEAIDRLRESGPY